MAAVRMPRPTCRRRREGPVVRFARWPRHAYVVTDRKRAAAARAQRREREALPLLAGIVAEGQPPVEAVMAERLVRWAETEAARRSARARRWREARRRLDALPAAERVAALAHWNGHRWLPGDPTYLLDLLHGLATGRLAVADGTLHAARPVIPVAEAVAAFGPAKPVARGWLAPVRGRGGG